MFGKTWTKEEETKLEKFIKSGKYSYRDMGKILDRSLESCKSHARELGINDNKYIYTIYSQNEKFWEVPNPINCYWAGISAADCCIRERPGNKYSYQIGLALLDKGHIEKFQKDSKHNGKIYVVKGQKKDKKTGKYKETTTANICVNSTKLAHDLANNFCIVPRKTHRLRPPNLHNRFFEFCYLLGVTDGDGTISFGYKEYKNSKYPIIQMRYVGCSRDIIEYIKNLVDYIFDCSFTARGTKIANVNVEHGKESDYYSYNVTGLRSFLLFNFLKDFPLPKMDRKWLQPKILEELEKQKLKYPDHFERAKKITKKIFSSS